MGPFEIIFRTISGLILVFIWNAIVHTCKETDPGKIVNTLFFIVTVIISFWITFKIGH